jgi:hypothetical protein
MVIRNAESPRPGGYNALARFSHGLPGLSCHLDGGEAGDAAYADNVNAGEELVLGPGKFVKVLEFVPLDEGGSPYAGLLMVELVHAGD